MFFSVPCHPMREVIFLIPHFCFFFCASSSFKTLIIFKICPIMEAQIQPFIDYATYHINASRNQNVSFISKRTFKAFFKLTPLGCAELWDRLTTLVPANIERNGVIFGNTHSYHLLWTLHYLYSYCTEEVGSALFGVTPKTYRKYTWAIQGYLQELKYKLVSFLQL